jgi:VWFA-related protein
MLFVCGGALSVPAQDADETVRVRHRVVFLDALVRDKRTSNLAADLQADNFEVLADGKPRAVSYFSREGDAARKPLALTIVLDLRRDGAGRFLRRTEILEAMAAEIAKLPPQDEVALMVLEAGGTDDKREWLAHFTRNRAGIAAALSIVPSLVAEGASGGETDMQPVNQSNDKATDKPQEGNTISISIGGGSKKEKEKEKAAGEKQDGATSEEKAKNESDRKQQALESPSTPVNESDIESQTVSTGKNGDTVTHTVYKNGEVRTRRVSKDGTVEIDINTEMDMGGAIHEIAKLCATERPASQPAIVWISDGIAPIFYAERDSATAELTRANIIFNALVADMKLGFKLFKPVLKPLGNWVGLSIYGSAQYLAKETGGEAVRVNRPADYANGLNKIIGNLTGRYSLGFTLVESEQDDNQMHPLEVRVKARDAKGKERKLTVTSRRGFYMPKENETAQTTRP